MDGIRGSLWSKGAAVSNDEQSFLFKLSSGLMRRRTNSGDQLDEEGWTRNNACG